MDDRLPRRAWLRRVAGLAAAVRAGQTGALQEVPPRIRELPFEELAGFRTPTERFFLRSHLDYPRIEPDSWDVTVEGTVRQPLRLGLAELERIPGVTRAVTFECSGNPPGGGLVGTAEFRGIPLGALLERAGLDGKATEVVFEGADAGLDEAESVPLVYARSVPLEKAVAAETLVAWEMNGAPLRREHGAPARVVVPGYYAMSHVKWLRRIRVLDRPFKGFYMTKRYFTARRSATGADLEIRPELGMKLKSQIARPAAGERIASPSVTVDGAAWTDEGVVTRVEVSADGGASWNVADLLDRPAAYAWVRWRYSWKPAARGRAELVCRAFDDRGGSQPEAPDPSVINRYGNNWYHRVGVVVQ